MSRAGFARLHDAINNSEEVWVDLNRRIVMRRHTSLLEEERSWTWVCCMESQGEGVHIDETPEEIIVAIEAAQGGRQDRPSDDHLLTVRDMLRDRAAHHDHEAEAAVWTRVADWLERIAAR